MLVDGQVRAKVQLWVLVLVLSCGVYSDVGPGPPVAPIVTPSPHHSKHSHPHGKT